jgi:hypothetical protein
MNRVSPIRRVTSLSACLLLIPLLAGACTLKLVSEYDEQIDASATALQKEMGSYLTELAAVGAGSPEETYHHNAAFYRSYEVSLRSVRIRAEANRQNQITVQQINNMLSSLQALAEVHEDQGTVSDAFINTTRGLMNTSWQAIIEWEIAKKRGS